MFKVVCSRCGQNIELLETPKHEGFLCNNCFLKWTDVRDKMIEKGCYQDEVTTAFFSFVKDLEFKKFI